MPEISTVGIFQVAFIARQMEQTPRAFFQTTFEPIGRVCAARHAHGGLGLQGKWRTRACVPHTPYMRATACWIERLKGRLKSKKAASTTCFLAEPLTPTAAPSSLPWERVRERATSRKACVWVVRKLGENCRNSGNTLSPALPHGGGSGLQQIQALQVVWKRMPETSTAGIFQAAFIARQMEQTPQAFFQTTFEPVGRVCAARHARGGLGLQGKWRTRAYRIYTTCGLRLAIFLAEPLIPTATLSSLPWERVRERATSRKACILGDQGIWERFPQFGECPLPSPPPRGRGRVAAGFAVSGGLKSNLDLQPLISGRLKNKKQPAQPVSLQNP